MDPINQDAKEIEPKSVIDNTYINEGADESNGNHIINDIDVNNFDDNDGSTADSNKAEPKLEDMPVECDFEGRELDAIVDCAVAGGEFMYRVKWKGVEMETLMPATVANHTWPWKVIAFYTKKLKNSDLFAAIEKL